MLKNQHGLNGIQIHGPMLPGYERILTADALSFIAELTRRFRGRIQERLTARQHLQTQLDAGKKLDFLPETLPIRESHWVAASLPDDLIDRRVEITGPVDRKMIINALNSGANVFMADFEDATSPTWSNTIEGQLNLFDAVRRVISYTALESSKSYHLQDNTATLVVRPRGLHLNEHHVWVDDAPVPGSLFDFGLYFFHNANELLQQKSGPYFYLPKLEHYLEARIWNEVFLFAQNKLGIHQGTIKATVLIETLPAAFQMHEILYELREHAAGLNCGRWDYIFSFIKKHRAHAWALLPDRSQVTMDKGFLRAYTQLLIQTCHRRGVHAMGGMAAQIPIKNDPIANENALTKVRVDKLREVTDGHDGTWVAHPGLVPIARSIFDEHMPTKNQIHRMREDVCVTQSDLLQIPEGTQTLEGLRHNIRVGIQYIAAWLQGQGCVPIYNLMEDAATAEIARTQVWQWFHHKAFCIAGEILSAQKLKIFIHEEVQQIMCETNGTPLTKNRINEARELFEQLIFEPQLEEFLTLPAYLQLIEKESNP